MAEITMDRAYTTLNIKVQKLKQAPQSADQIAPWFHPPTDPAMYSANKNEAFKGIERNGSLLKNG
jgi:hypothetical protein